MFNDAYLPIRLQRSQPLLKMAPPRSTEFLFLCLSHDKAQEIPPFPKMASPLSRNLDSCAYLMIRLRRSHYPCLVITPPRSTEFLFLCLSDDKALEIPPFLKMASLLPTNRTSVLVCFNYHKSCLFVK